MVFLNRYAEIAHSFHNVVLLEHLDHLSNVRKVRKIKVAILASVEDLAKVRTLIRDHYKHITKSLRSSHLRPLIQSLKSRLRCLPVSSAKSSIYFPMRVHLLSAPSEVPVSHAESRFFSAPCCLPDDLVAYNLMFRPAEDRISPLPSSNRILC